MINKNDLKCFVDNNKHLVNMKLVSNGMFVLKYSKKCFYNNIWNEFINECRGAVIDKDFNLISYPFTKIHNYGIEKEAPKLSDNTLITAFRKVNGFMCAITWHNDALLISTTGSIDSNYVKMAEEFVNKNRHDFETWCEFHNNFTFLFECVHEKDPHIITEKPGLYLLGMRKKEWGSEIMHDQFKLDTFAKYLKTHHVDSLTTNIGRLKELAKECRHEGFVFYTENGISAKIKSPYYLTLKWLARNPKVDRIVDVKNDIKHNLDEEYYGLVDRIRADITNYTGLDEQGRLSYIKEYFTIA